MGVWIGWDAEAPALVSGVSSFCPVSGGCVLWLLCGSVVTLGGYQSSLALSSRSLGLRHRAMLSSWSSISVCVESGWNMAGN